MRDALRSVLALFLVCGLQTQANAVELDLVLPVVDDGIILPCSAWGKSIDLVNPLDSEAEVAIISKDCSCALSLSAKSVEKAGRTTLSANSNLEGILGPFSVSALVEFKHGEQRKIVKASFKAEIRSGVILAGGEGRSISLSSVDKAVRILPGTHPIISNIKTIYVRRGAADPLLPVLMGANNAWEVPVNSPEKPAFGLIRHEYRVYADGEGRVALGQFIVAVCAADGCIIEPCPLNFGFLSKSASTASTTINIELAETLEFHEPNAVVNARGFSVHIEKTDSRKLLLVVKFIWTDANRIESGDIIIRDRNFDIHIPVSVICAP